jgi:hypothetical protein
VTYARLSARRTGDHLPHPQHPYLISLNVILCEKVLLEQDQTYSAIRITDVFYFRRNPESLIEEQPIPMCVLVLGKTKPEHAEEHNVQLILTRPNGEQAYIGGPLAATF